MFSTSSPLFLVGLACKLAMDTTQVARRTFESLTGKVESTRNSFASLIKYSLSGSSSPTLDKALSPRQHPGSPGLARPSPASGERRVALTLGWKGGEAGADFCHLGIEGLKLHHRHKPFMNNTESPVTLSSNRTATLLHL